MHIRTEDPSFSPVEFQIHSFYGKSTCFCWNDRKLALLPYTVAASESLVVSAELYTAPGRIKEVQCYSGRIFLICSPHGIYKLSKDREFAVLSKSAIGMGNYFYEVLTPRSAHLCLENKSDTSRKELFKLSSAGSKTNEICILSLTCDDADGQFLEALSSQASFSQAICIIAYKNKLFKLIKGTAYLLHTTIFPISTIVPIFKASKVIGLMLVSSRNSLVAMYPKCKKFLFEDIYYLGAIKLRTLCAGISHKVANMLWIVYSDDSKLYYGKKHLSEDNFQKMEMQDRSFACLRCLKSESILGLTSNGQLVEFSIEAVERRFSSENDTWVNLEGIQFNETERLVNRIAEKAQVLNSLNQSLLAAERKLQRISFYTHKKQLPIIPAIFANRIFKKTFVIAQFDYEFPLNSSIVFSLRTKYGTIFNIKKVNSPCTTVELHIPDERFLNGLNIQIDLVTLSSAEEPWCLIRDCLNEVRKRKSRKKRVKEDKMNVFQSKMEILEKYMEEPRNIDRRKVLEIKRSIRKEFEKH